MVDTVQAMKRIDQIKVARQARHFKARMDAHKSKKKLDLENELLKHADLIEDPNVKSYIMEKKAAKQQKQIDENTIKRGSIFKKMKAMQVDEDGMQVDDDSEELANPETDRKRAKIVARKSRRSKGGISKNK